MVFIKDGSNRFGKHDFIAVLVLVLLGGAVYANTFGFDFTWLDDSVYVTENEHVNSGISLNNVAWAFQLNTYKGAHWHPLAWISHMVDCHLFGVTPGPHRLMNVLLHIFNAVLLFFIFRISTGDAGKSLMIAGLFIVHPTAVESVVWISERKNLLSTFFGLFAILSWVIFAHRRNWRFYLLTLTFFVLSLLSKPMVVTMPFVLLLLDMWPLRRFRNQAFGETDVASDTVSARTALLEKLPFLSVSLLFLCILFIVSNSVDILEQGNEIGIGLRVANAIVSYSRYIGMAFAPINLALFYPFPTEMLPIWQIVGSAMLLGVVSGLALLLRRRLPFLFVGWFLFLGTLVPVLGLVQKGIWPAMADRFVYFPYIGLFVVVVWGISRLWREYALDSRMLRVISIAALLAMGVTTWVQAQYWRSTIRILERTLEVTEDNYFAHGALGGAYADAHKYSEAIEQYEAGTRLKVGRATAAYNLGSLLLTLGDTEKGIGYLKNAVEIRPAYHDALLNLSAALLEDEQLSDAYKYLTLLLEQYPGSIEGHVNFGILCVHYKKLDDAIGHFEKVIFISPEHSTAYLYLGMAYAGKGAWARAKTYIQKAILLQPENIEFKRALRYIKQNQLSDGEKGEPDLFLPQRPAPAAPIPAFPSRT